VNKLPKGWVRVSKQRFFRRERFQVTVFYDGWCPLCSRSAETAKKLDTLRLLEFVSYREPGVTGKYGLDPAKLEQRLHTTTDGRHFREGIDALIQLTSRVIPFWPLVPLLLLAKVLGFGQWAYDQVAKRRTIIPAGGCEDKCSIEPQ
jgi:predicted DCC family thiol-disulfide oxidoreductase YuxK